MTSYNRYGPGNLNHLWIIMILNLLVFLGTTLDHELLFVFGLIPIALIQQPWTIITSMFTHAGLWHILANMLTLYFYGNFLTGLIGAGRMMAIYFAGGLFGNIVYIMVAYLNILHSSPFQPVVGASGALFALGGTLSLLAPNVKVIAFPIPVPIPLWVAVIGGFFIISLFPGIAWQAHLGGLIVGLLAGWYLKRRVTPRFFS